jgi:hypothetical protein
MRRPAVVFVAALCGWLTARPSVAQQPGQRIRVTIDSLPSTWLVGTIAAVDADSFRVAVVGKGPRWVARKRVVRLEVSRGQRNAMEAGAFQGVDFGALFGAVIAARSMAKPCAWPTAAAAVCGETRILVGTGLGGALGAIVGAAIGSLIKRERWEAASAAQPQIVLSPEKTGLALSVAF